LLIAFLIIAVTVLMAVSIWILFLNSLFSSAFEGLDEAGFFEGLADEVNEVNRPDS